MGKLVLCVVGEFFLERNISLVMNNETIQPTLGFF